MEDLTVIKLNLQGEETWRYPGRLISRDGNSLQVEATFNREDTLFHGMPMHKDDRFVETYYTDRWYNIYEIYAREDGHLRGWYCNVTRPAELEGDRLSYVDLALDLLVFPDGRQMVLDEDEFRDLNLSSEEEAQARQALAELQRTFQERTGA